MKKPLYSAIFFILSCQIISAAPLDSIFNDGSLPSSYYEITESNPDLLASVSLYPIIWDYSSDKISAFSGGGSLQFYINKNIGLYASGMKSYYFMNLDSASDPEIKSFSNYELEGGISYAFYSKTKSVKYPLVLGSEMTGYNTRTDYYVNIKMPTKTAVAARTGYLRNSQSYKEESFNTDSVSRDKEVNTLYGGIEFFQSRSAEIQINQEDIERQFGSKFRKKEFSKFYLDGLYSFSHSGNIETKKDLGFRIGFLANTGIFSMKIEGGYSPAEEYFAAISMGIGLSFFSPEKKQEETSN